MRLGLGLGLVAEQVTSVGAEAVPGGGAALREVTAVLTAGLAVAAVDLGQG